MKITCTAKELARGIAIAGRAVSPRSTMPIMTNLLLAADDGELRISGTSMPMRIDCSIPCTVALAGALTIPARLFGDIVSKLNGNISLEVNDKTKSLEIACGNYKAKINGLDAADFPTVPTDQPISTASVKASTLRQMIDQVAFAAAADISRMTLSGVNVTINDDHIRMAATDGYRLARRRGQLEQPADEQGTIVPADSLRELSQALSSVDPAEAVIMSFYRNRLDFRTTGIAFSAQTVDGKFPDYQAIIPKSHNTTAKVEAKAFQRALQVARILVRRDDESERFDLAVKPETSQLAISAINNEIGNSGDALTAEIAGKEITISLDIGYVLDVLSRVDDEFVELRLVDERKPFVMLLDGKPEEEFIQVIMPMAVNK